MVESSLLQALQKHTAFGTWTQETYSSYRWGCLVKQAGTWWQTNTTRLKSYGSVESTSWASWHVSSKDQRPISSLKNSVMVDGGAVKGHKSAGSCCHIMTWGSMTDCKRPSHCYSLCLTLFCCQTLNLYFYSTRALTRGMKNSIFCIFIKYKHGSRCAGTWGSDSVSAFSSKSLNIWFSALTSDEPCSLECDSRENIAKRCSEITKSLLISVMCWNSTMNLWADFGCA